MLENWLKPVHPNNFISFDNLSPHHFGRSIKIFKGKKVPSLKRAQIVIIGLDEIGANHIRRSLYALTSPHATCRIVDLGNLRKVHPEFLIPVLKECMSSNLLPIIIGKHQAFTTAQYNAYKHRRELINAVVLNERIPYTLDTNKKRKDFYYLNQMIDPQRAHLFHLNLIGFQSHFTDKKVIHHLESKHVNLLRLGKLSSNLEMAESLIRDANMMSMDLSLIKKSDAPGQSLASPCGCFGEQACQLAYFGGISDKLNSFGLYGYDFEKDEQGSTSQLAAQIIWYFCNGFGDRFNDIPLNPSKSQKYIVELSDISFPLTFWKSKKSNRWWLELPLSTKKKMNAHRLLPCTPRDYQLATHGEISDHLFNAIQRFV